MKSEKEFSSEHFRRALLDLSAAIRAGDEADSRLKKLIEISARALAVQRVGIWIFDNDGTRLMCQELYGVSAPHAHPATLYNSDNPAYFDALKNGVVIAADDAGNGPRTAGFRESYLEPMGITSMLDAPIHANSRMIGVVCHEHVEELRHWTTDEQVLSTLVADFVALALESEQRRRAETEHQRIATRLTALTGAMNSGIVMEDCDESIVYVNRAFCQMFGLPGPDVILGKRCRQSSEIAKELFTDPGDFVALVERRLDERKTVLGTELTLRDGRALEQDYVAIVNDGGECLGHLWQYRDVTERKRTEEALRASQAQLTEAQRIAHLGSWDLDISTGEARWSDEEYRLLGYEPGQVQASWMRFLDAVHPDDRARVTKAMERAIQRQGESYSIEHRVVLPNGEERIIHQRGRTICDSGGIPLRMIGSTLDITERKRAENALKASNEQLEISQQRLALHVEQTPLAVIEWNTAFEVVDWNPAAERIFGYDKAAAIGKSVEFIIPYSMQDHVRAVCADLVANRGGFRSTNQNIRKDGRLITCEWYNTPLINDRGQVIGVASLVDDVSKRKEVEERLIHQANFDTLTSLPNRILALDRLSQALVRARRGSRFVALMFIDLDLFKNVNDTLGHAAGDRLLVEVSERLQTCIREADTVARLGGDEFLVILPDLVTAKDAEIVAEKILDNVSAPYVLDGYELVLTASIGLTTYPGDGDDPHILLRNADAAMYRAKDDGRNTYCFFTPAMNEEAIKRLELESHLRHAIENDELDIDYQPQVDIRSGHVVGAEALLRWTNPKLGTVPPDQFIPLAEDTGLILAIGDWVLRKACEQAKVWQRQGLPPLRVSVNISTRQFRNANFLGTVSDVLQANELAPTMLELEITESLLVADAPETTVVLDELRKMGVRLSLDDFGTGYSSLSYLKRFPFDVLKIDRSFVRDITTDPEDAALCKAILAMANSLNLEVVGEGVETAEQLEFLRVRGADLAQGFYLSKPLPADDFRRLVEARVKEKGAYG